MATHVLAYPSVVRRGGDRLARLTCARGEVAREKKGNIRGVGGGGTTAVIEIIEG